MMAEDLRLRLNQSQNPAAIRSLRLRAAPAMNRAPEPGRPRPRPPALPAASDGSRSPQAST